MTNLERAKKFLDELLEEGIKPNAEAIAEIVIDGSRVAVVVYDVDDKGAEFARALGWDGKSPAFAMLDEQRKRMANNIERSHPADKATPRWLRRMGPGRIFVVLHGGSSLLVNFEPGVGYSIEPGSTDAAWMS